MKKYTLALASVFLFNQAQAESAIDVDLSSDVVRLALATPLANGNLIGSGSYLHHEDNGDLFSAGLSVAGKSKASRGQQTTGLGFKAVGFTTDEDRGDVDGAALALGGFIRHNLSDANLISLRGDLYYAPSVVSFGDADKYLEFSFRVEYELMENANLYAGYRKIEIDIKDVDGEADLDSSGHVGINLLF